MLLTKVSEKWYWEICLLSLTDKEWLFTRIHWFQVPTAWWHTCSAVRVRRWGIWEVTFMEASTLRLTSHLWFLCALCQPETHTDSAPTEQVMPIDGLTLALERHRMHTGSWILQTFRHWWWGLSCRKPPVWLFRPGHLFSSAWNDLPRLVYLGNPK